MSSWVHNGKQYVLVQLEDGLAAMAIPGPEDAKNPTHH